MTQSVLILGANGFIGSHLTERVLAERDWNVFGIDIVCDRLEGFAANPRFAFERADIVADFEAVDRRVRECDVVFPLIAIATPRSYVQNPLRVFELTFEANLAVIRSCVRHKKRVVFASSSEVYGMCEDEAFDEEHSPLVMGPIDRHRWIYACSKQLLDRVIHAYAFEKNLQYTIFRPFNWIGPRLDNPHDPLEGSSRVLTQFIGNLLRSEDLRLVDGGHQRRCFLYVDDAIDCLLKIIENRGGAADQQIFNVGNPAADVSIRELAELLLELVADYPGFENIQRHVRCVEVDSRTYYGRGYQDILMRRPSIRKAQERLGWGPTTDLRTALRKTLDCYFAADGAGRLESAAPRAAAAVARTES
jgi:nucleoside-diphosphate-sugar epimerase